MINKSVLIILLVFANNVWTKQNAAEKASAKNLSAVTVFVDITSFTRKHAAAAKMTKQHQQFAEHGYELVSLSPYIENGDLEGFFVSYKKIVNSLD